MVRPLCPLCPLCSDPLTGRKSGVVHLEFSAASEAQAALKLNGGCGAVGWGVCGVLWHWRRGRTRDREGTPRFTGNRKHAAR